MSTNEHKNAKIFLVMPDGASIELQIISKLHIREIIQIARQEEQSTNQVLKIFKENEFLRSSMIIEQNDLRDGQVFQAQTLKKQQSLFYKRATSEPQEIIVDIQKQKIADIIQLIKKEIGLPENKQIQAKLKDQILDQDRYFYEYKNILYNHITINEDETPNDLQIPIQEKEENRQIFLKISYQSKIIQVLCSYSNTINEVCMNIQKKVKTTETFNLYQNYKKLNKNSILANFLIVSQANLMASIYQKSYNIIVKYQNLEQQLTIDPKQTVNKLQQEICQIFHIPQNINLSLKLNNMDLDQQNNLEEYFIQDQQAIDVQIISKKYTFIMPDLKKEIKVQIEDINITIIDIVESIKQQLKFEHINFCAYEGKNRLNMKINIEQVNLKTSIIALWIEEQKTIEKEVALCINVVDLKKFHLIQIAQDQKIKSLEFIIQDKYKINENLQFYYNQQLICSDYTIKELGITGQIEIVCQIAKRQYDIQVRYKGIIKQLTVCRTWLVQQLIERSKQIYQINKDNFIVVQDQTILNKNYELNNYLIDETLDICEQGLSQFSLKVLMNNDTVRLNIIINYSSTILDLYNNLIDKYRGRKFYVYYDRKKQQKKKLLREFDLDNLLACEINNVIKFNIQIQEQLIVGQIVNSKVIIGDYFNQLFQNNNKGFKLTIQDIILDQKQRFSYYLIQETDMICIEIPDQVYKLQVEGSQLNCQLISQNIGQFQEQKQTLTFEIRFLNKANQKFQITAQVKSKLSDLLQRLNFTNFDINVIQVHHNNQLLDINKTLESLGIKMNDMLEAYIEQQIIIIKISINKKQPNQYKINILWNAQQLIDFICQKEKLQPQNCKLYQKDKEIQNNTNLKGLLLKDGDLLDILYKQKLLLRQLSCRQMSNKQIKQLSKSPYSKEFIKNKELKTTRKAFCLCGPQSETCRCGRYKTIFS